MTKGFQNTTLEVLTSNGLDDILEQPLVFYRLDGSVLRAPIGGTTDGLSVPRCLQNLIPATGGDWFSGVLHDSAYRNQLQILCKVTHHWTRANYTRAEADGLILEAMKSQGVSFLMRWTIYLALRAFGGFAFRADRKNYPVKPVVQ